ncbi:MAG: hypothetical protein ACREEK_29350, partial [Bradyrhizobium sp.]
MERQLAAIVCSCSVPEWLNAAQRRHGLESNDSLQAPEAQMTKRIAELIEQRFGLPSTAGHDTPAEGELTAILSHRTHRRYTDMPI